MPTTPATPHPTQAPNAPTRALWTEKQAAEYLSVSPRTLQAWRVKGGGPAFLKMGASVRYRPEVLAAWVEALPSCENTSEHSPAAA